MNSFAALGCGALAKVRGAIVAIGGGGFVTGVVFHPGEKGLAYARTDVGGAYRWDDKLQRWVALTDWLAPEDDNLMGIESIAIDPSDPERVYLAAGTYLNARVGNGAILRDHVLPHLKPVLLVVVVLGVIVGGMVVAMYLPIFDMVNAVQ